MRSLLHPGEADALVRRVESLDSTAERLWGRMTPNGMICHLTDAFLVVMGERQAGRSPRLHERTLLRWLALSTPVPWPKGVPTAPACDQELEGTPPVELERDKTRLIEALERFLARVPSGELVHPAFGRMSTGEWGRWGFRHMDHHLRQFGS